MVKFSMNPGLCLGDMPLVLSLNALFGIVPTAVHLELYFHNHFTHKRTPRYLSESVLLRLGLSHSLKFSSIRRNSFVLSQKKNVVIFRPCFSRGQGQGCPVRLRSIVSLQHTLCFQADVFVSGTDDDVVKKLNTDDASDLDEPFGHLDIFPRWMRVTARMLMADDE